MEGAKGLWAMGGLWILCLCAGFYLLDREQFTPLPPSAAAPSFPKDSRFHLPPDKPLLLVFAHPQCPCTRASFHELEQLMTETGNKLSVLIVFTIPEGVPQGWEKGDLLNIARKIPGAEVYLDHDGIETRHFHVQGSGDVRLYGSSGTLLFSGGITPSRGHEGDNAGRSSISSMVTDGRILASHTPVFGCSLF